MAAARRHRTSCLAVLALLAGAPSAGALSALQGIAPASAPASAPGARLLALHPSASSPSLGSCLRLRGGLAGGGSCTGPACGGRALPDVLGFGAWQASQMSGGGFLWAPMAVIAGVVVLGNVLDGTRGWDKLTRQRVGSTYLHFFLSTFVWAGTVLLSCCAPMPAVACVDLKRCAARLLQRRWHKRTRLSGLCMWRTVHVPRAVRRQGPPERGCGCGWAETFGHGRLLHAGRVGWCRFPLTPPWALGSSGPSSSTGSRLRANIVNPASACAPARLAPWRDAPLGKTPPSGTKRVFSPGGPHSVPTSGIQGVQGCRSWM